MHIKENSRLYLVASAELLLGISLAVLESINLAWSYGWPDAVISTAQNIGLGFIAAGIITLTVEPISRRRSSKEIEAIKNAHFEAILKGIIPAKIFDEMESQVLKQP